MLRDEWSHQTLKCKFAFPSLTNHVCAEAERAIPCATALENASTAAAEVSNPDLDFEVNLELPEGLLGQFQGRDVSIEMEYSLAQGAAFNSAEITVEDGVPEASFNGKGDALSPC